MYKKKNRSFCNCYCSLKTPCQTVMQIHLMWALHTSGPRPPQGPGPFDHEGVPHRPALPGTTCEGPQWRESKLLDWLPNSVIWTWPIQMCPRCCAYQTPGIKSVLWSILVCVSAISAIIQRLFYGFEDTAWKKKSHIPSLTVKVAYSQMVGGKWDRAGPTSCF